MEDDPPHEMIGCLVGQVGARFENVTQMEALYIKNVNRDNILPGSPLDKGLGSYFQCTEGIPWGSGWEVKKYKIRIKDTALAFLVDANSRGKHVYCHVVGLGLGVWSNGMPSQILERHEIYYLEAYKEVQDIKLILKDKRY